MTVPATARYAISYAAYKDAADGFHIVRDLDIIHAHSRVEAVGVGHRRAQEEWPVEDGWAHMRVQVMEVDGADVAPDGGEDGASDAGGPVEVDAGVAPDGPPDFGVYRGIVGAYAPVRIVRPGGDGIGED